MTESTHADQAVTEPTGDTQPDTESNPVVDELDVHNGEPLRPTFFDANGVERIAGPPVENWTPAQVDPTEEQIARNEAMHAREAARRDESLALLGQPTSEPLLEANRSYHDELDAASDGSDGGVTDVTPTDPSAPATPVTEPTSTPASPDPAPVTAGQTDQQAVDAAAVADADANVAAQVEAERAQAAQAQAQADDTALTDAEAKQVTDEEAQS